MLKKLFRYKRSKPKEEETKKEDDKPPPPATEIIEEPPKRFETNVVYTFQDLKAASFPPHPPPPPSVDAAVSTNLKEQVPSVEKNGKEEFGEKEKKDEIKDEDKSDEKTRPSIANEICEEKTCGKEKCSPDTCEKTPPRKSPRQSEDKIIHMKLTEMINTSIKEAMQTIVKQCRMNQGDEENIDEKPKADYDKTICVDGKEEIPAKVRHEYRPRTTPDQLNDRSRISKPRRVQEKYKNVHSSPKKFHDKKRDLLEEIRNKRHAKSANNVKTDNRRMTGNVNIYICSEANENAQQSRKQKKAETCMESSSDTTTEHSKVSSSKLVTCIRNKRRKSKEQNSVDCLTKKDENSDDSTVCTCVSKYTDSCSENNSIIEVCSAFNKDVCAKNIESLGSETLTDSECTEANINNVQLTLDKPEFVLCDQIEKPCSTIYPMKSLSNSDSEGWSSKSSSRNAGSIPADKWSLELNLDHSNTYMNNLKCGYPASEGIPRRNIERICLCQKKNRESTGRYTMRCNCRNKKRSASKTLEQEWPTCNCIAEEEEEDVYVDGKASKKYGDEKKETLVDSGESGKLVPCTDYSAETGKGMKKPKEEEETEEVKDTEKEAVEKVPAKVEESEGISTKTAHGMSLKLVRPEAMVLKNILQHEGKQPAQPTDQKNIPPAPAKRADVSEQPGRNVVKTTQDILKRFNIPEEYKFLKKVPVEEEQTPPDETGEKIDEKMVEGKGNKEDKDTKNLQGKTKETSVFKRLKKIIGKPESPQTKDGKFVGEDKVNETTSNVGDVKNIEKTNVDGDQLPAKDNETKGAHKEKEKFNFSKLNLYKTVKNIKKEKSERNANANSPTIKTHRNNDKNDDVTDATIKKEDTQETTSDVNKEAQNKSEQSPVADKKNLSASQQAKSQNSPKQSEPRKIMKSPTIDEPPKRTKLEEKLNIKEKEKANHQEEITTPVEKRPIRKLSINEEKESSSLQYPQHRKIDSHTICINSKYPKSSTMNESFHSDGSICNCCCSSMSEYTNEPINYPKSCLKKERTFYQHIDSQRSHFSLPYHDKRNWEDCCCRRIIPCNSCCRPRNDARLTVNCTGCYKPKNKCNCKPIYDTKNTCECMKSMFCLYCDKPRDKCVCRAPVAKCSCCELAIDLCTCKDQKTICDGRPVLTEPEEDRTMYVTAWKPREEIRRYFSRNLTDLRADPINEHCCCEKLKPHNSDDLPYQRLSVFSDVMDELQQKMSESTCCTRCRKIPCCCNIKADREEVREERKIKYCISPKTRRKIIAVCMEKSKSKLNCKCDTGQGKNEKQKKIIVALCCACKATPCRCKKSKSSQKKPKAKCYYCKSSPCVCITARERNKPRPCRCTDSPCRTMEKESVVPCGKISTKPKNNDEKTICMR